MPITPMIFNLKVMPKVKVTIMRLTVVGLKPKTAARKKKSLTMPSGKINPITSPKTVPIRAPNKMAKTAHRMDNFFLILLTPCLWELLVEKEFNVRYSAE